MISSIGTGISGIASRLGELSSTSTATGAGSFSDVLKSAIRNVDTLQSGADGKVSNLLAGAPNTDVGNVMVSVEKADVAFQLMMQVRNKIVSAYQDIEKLQF